MLKRFSKYLLVTISIILITTGCSNKLNIIDNKDDLNNKNIGVYTGSEYDTIAQDNIENPKILYYNSYSDQISALKSGKIDGFLTDEPLAKEIIKENKELKILKEKLTEDSYAFAINPSKNNLQDEIDKELVKMNKNGKLKTFEDKWMGNDESKKELEVYHYDDSKGVVKFATVSGSAPFAYMKNNKIVGYDIDVISYICNELGYKLEIIEMSFDGIIPALKSGKVDVAGCSIIVTEERKKSVLFSEPDYTGGIVVVVRGKNEKQN
ncbi:MAG: transporter substrate-binding domain-containing protein [Bacilli bacterium]|nr:transporter substrate-binding domain-containing protein [Bacilli bacterium]